MFGFGKSAKACNEAVGTLKPLVANSDQRLGGISEHAWYTPYMIGYMSMLISLIAKQQTNGEISDEQLGRTQQDAWAKITGRAHDSIGEEICVLSVGRDISFKTGCENALQFMQALCGESDQLDPSVLDLIEKAERDFLPDSTLSTINETDEHLALQQDLYGKGSTLAQLLWIGFFDDHIA